MKAENEIIEEAAIAISKAPLANDYYVTNSGNMRSHEVRSDMEMAKTAFKVFKREYGGQDKPNTIAEHYVDTIVETSGLYANHQQKLKTKDPIAEKLAEVRIINGKSLTMNPLSYKGHDWQHLQCIRLLADIIELMRSEK